MTHPIYSHDAWSDYRLRVEFAGRQGRPVSDDHTRCIRFHMATWGEWREACDQVPTEPYHPGYPQGSNYQNGREPTEEEEEAQADRREEQRVEGYTAAAWAYYRHMQREAGEYEAKEYMRETACDITRQMRGDFKEFEVHGHDPIRCSILAGQSYDDEARARRATIMIDRDVLLARLRRAFDATAWRRPTDVTP